MQQTTSELLAEYAVLLNRFGPDSEEANSFLNSHRHNTDFVELAEISAILKKALTTPAWDGVSQQPQWN